MIEALRARLPDARFAGIAGPKMIAAGCEAWERAESLVRHGPLRGHSAPAAAACGSAASSIERVLSERPAVYVGVDAKEFNLRLAPRSRQQGIRTVQYVSPQVWAWRQGRVRTIGRAVDLVLCLLPFEKQFYDAHAVRAEFVGHPLADQIPLHLDAERRARERWACDAKASYVALLPGSRHGEVSRLSPDFAATVALAAAASARSAVRRRAGQRSRRVADVRGGADGARACASA